MTFDPDLKDPFWREMFTRMTARRQERILAMAAKRTRHIRLAVQDIHSPHNVSACLRSAEAFGLLDVDVVNFRESFRPSTVSRGVGRWLRVKAHSSAEAFGQELHDAGYQIAAGYPGADAVSLYDLDVNQPICILFGNEHEGVDERLASQVDIRFTIPMVGMVESLNISVAAAITLNELTRKSERELGEAYFLSKEEQAQYVASLLKKQFPRVAASMAKGR